MKAATMKPGIWYEVTAIRSPGSFRKGDHIKLEKNGDVSCKQAKGWIEAEFAGEELAKVSAKPAVIEGFTEFRLKHGKDLPT